MHSTRSHASDHKRWFANESRKLGLDVNAIFRLESVKSPKREDLDETGTILFDPVDIISDATFSPFKHFALPTDSSTTLKTPNNDNSDTSTIFIPMSQVSEARDSTGAKVKDMSCTGEGSSLFPLNRKMSDHLNKQWNNIRPSRKILKILPRVRSINRKRKFLRCNRKGFKVGNDGT